ncbi:hypothetical protein GWI33_001751 [Rhynchophorus ferrugineus]|uniref:Uncharacterized protein n=1 Tax=Rhynchophorus ferrugineus TaxID=354439 RepID=A0A834MG77_RHYFE|nr:hypothetical protein GWI33_001751 [Rhynchophorus ferrugineus]
MRKLLLPILRLDIIRSGGSPLTDKSPLKTVFTTIIRTPWHLPVTDPQASSLVRSASEILIEDPAIQPQPTAASKAIFMTSTALHFINFMRRDYLHHVLVLCANDWRGMDCGHDSRNNEDSVSINQGSVARV